MNSTSQSPEHFSLGSGPNAMDNKTLIATLAVSASIALMFILLLYTLRSGRTPEARMGYGIFMSFLPAVGAYVVLKLTNVFVSWWGAVIVYFSLFVLVLIIHAFGQMMPVNS